MLIRLRLNGATTELDVAPMRRLLDVLREELHLTGMKEGCGEGQCGSCTVLLDNEAVNACLVVIAQCDGHELVTVEGLPPSSLALQLFAARDLACGDCASGLLLSTEALLNKHPSPSEPQMRQALAGNLCRCMGTERLLESLRAAVAQRARASSNGSAR